MKVFRQGNILHIAELNNFFTFNKQDISASELKINFFAEKKRCEIVFKIYKNKCVILEMTIQHLCEDQKEEYTFGKVKNLLIAVIPVARLRKKIVRFTRIVPYH